MSCRTTPASSAITSYARIAEGPGDPISDVATLSLFHQLRADYPNEVRRASYRSRGSEAPSDIAVGEVLNRYAYISGNRETDEEVYQRLLSEFRADILADTTITEARKASLLARLDAADRADVPDQATIYALAKLKETVNRQRTAQETFLRESSAELGISYEDARAKFRALEEGIDRARSAPNPETYTEENINKVENLGMAKEAGVVHAFATMSEEVRVARTERLQATPSLIAEYRPVSGGRVPDQPFEVINYGYDPVSGYLEINVKNLETGEEEVKAYRAHMTADRLNAGMGGESSIYRYGEEGERTLTAGEFWFENFHNRYYTTFNNEQERLAASRAPRCARCGQWADNAHSCPTELSQGPSLIISPRMLRNEEVRTSSQKVQYLGIREGSETGMIYEVDLPLVNDYRRLFREHGSLLIRNVQGQASWQDRELVTDRWANIRTEGDVYIYRDENGETKAELRGLKCSCIEYKENNYQCRHTRAIGDAAIARSVPPQRSVASLTPAERERRLADKQARIEAAAKTDWTRNEETLAEARRTWKKNSEVVYSENFDQFYEVLEKVTEEKAAKGALTIPYKKDNALGGLATRESGQAFGVEIEYDFPDTMSSGERSEANEKIGKALFEAGISNSPQKQGYHAAASRGYKDVHVDENGVGTWSWEHDGTVAGEIVTPPMYDEPETWDKLEKVISILKDNGAVSSTRAGAHVHVGTGKYGKDPKKYEELARMVGQHEDVLFRVSTDPSRGVHRGLASRFTYVAPARPVSPSGFAEAHDVRRWQSSRSSIINMNTVKMDDSFKSSHVEFRMFDSTLDTGVIQQQVKLAVSMTDSANRIAHAGGTKRGKESLGEHAERLKLRGRRKPKKEDVAEETATFRSLLDTLYQSKEDKDNLIRIFAANTWLKLPLATRRRFGLVSN